MDENSTQADRISQLMRHFRLNQTSFSQEIGIKQPNLSPVFHGRKELSLGMIKAILKKYDTLSANWLILGEGPMFGEERSSKKTAPAQEMKESGAAYRTASEGDAAEALEVLRLLLDDHGRRIAGLEAELRLLKGVE